jgi:signal transduction histidine kinase
MAINLRLTKTNNYGQIIGPLILALGYVLFVISSFNYSNKPWFYFLIGGRLLAIFLAIIVIIIQRKNFNESKVDSYYYTFCLGLQAFHGSLEGSTSIDFYSYTGIFFIIASLSVSTTFKNWLTCFFPIQILFLIFPLFLKNSIYFTSLGKFIDSFSLPVSGLIIGLVIVWINTQKHEMYLQNIKLKDDLAKEQERISKQLAHDIRSPLASLNMVTRDLNSLPESYRLIIRNSVGRINDIANSLLHQSNQNNSESINLLSAIVDSLISEKRIQYRDKMGVEIELDHSSAYGIFVNINPTELSRLLSNLINNSIEAFPSSIGKILVKLSNEENNVLIYLEDNGKGIPSEALKKLGEEGFSFNKKDGFGLGIYHAKKTIENFGGTFNIESSLGNGTKVFIKLPKSLTPFWFVDQLKITHNQNIISLDDDIFIHQIWKNRLSKNSNVQLETYTSALEFSTYISKMSEENRKNSIYLIDYELLNQGTNGLDIIDKLNIGTQSILVTSHYEEKSIRNRCEQLKVRLIPKSMASIVPINIDFKIAPKVDENSLLALDYNTILIDDDELVRLTWEMKARQKNNKIKTYKNYCDFLKDVDHLNRKAVVYIDSSLGSDSFSNEIHGEDLVPQIIDLGFNQILIASGYDPDHFSEVKNILGVVGKSPPF